VISFWFDFVVGISVGRVIGASQDCGDHKVIAFFAFAAIGPDSIGGLKEIKRIYLLLPL
jgi:hypothetical protein